MKKQYYLSLSVEVLVKPLAIGGGEGFVRDQEYFVTNRGTKSILDLGVTTEPSEILMFETFKEALEAHDKFILSASYRNLYNKGISKALTIKKEYLCVEEIEIGVARAKVESDEKLLLRKKLTETECKIKETICTLGGLEYTRDELKKELGLTSLKKTVENKKLELLTSMQYNYEQAIKYRHTTDLREDYIKKASSKYKALKIILNDI